MRWNDFDIPDAAILAYIENNKRLRKKVQRLLGRITGGKKRAPKDQLSAAGKAGAAARWSKVECPTCKGIGKEQIGNRESQWITCRQCDGSGKVDKQGANQ